MNGHRIIEIDNVNFGEALRYLGYGNNKPDEQTEKMLSKCAKVNAFKEIYDNRRSVVSFST